MPGLDLDLLLIFSSDEEINNYNVQLKKKLFTCYRPVERTEETFVSVPLKQDNRCRCVQRHSLCLFADPPSSAVFSGVINVV